MEIHHRAWLCAHPSRSDGWLKDKLRDGFDVHHIDGDHTNNDPENLVLLEHDDHMRFHGAPLGGLRFGTIEWTKCRSVHDIDPDKSIGAKIFWAKHEDQVPFKQSAEEMGFSARIASKLADRYRKSSRYHEDAYRRRLEAFIPK